MMKKERFTLEDLLRNVSELLRKYDLLDAQQDGRVSPVPDIRTVRYYTGLGLIDRPLLQGRQAWYGRRHLLQLLAIKAMQGTDASLSRIQALLYGKTDRELEVLLADLARRRKESSKPLPVLSWKEITIEPGLKLVAVDSWSPGLSESQREEKIRAALEVLGAQKMPHSKS